MQHRNKLITKITLSAMSSLLTLILSSCSLSSPFSLNPSHPLTPNETCTNLKRRIIFYQNDVNHDTQWTSPTKRAQLLDDYEANNCPEIMGEKAREPQYKNYKKEEYKS